MANVDWKTRLESFKEEIYQAFMAYVTHATDVLAQQQRSKEPVVNAPVRLVHENSTYALRSLADKAEDSPQFNYLLYALYLPIREILEPARSFDTLTGDDLRAENKRMTLNEVIVLAGALVIKEKYPESARSSDKLIGDDFAAEIQGLTPDELFDVADREFYIRARNNLSDFFKRSYFYLNAFSGKKQSLDELFDILWSGLRREYHAKTTNLSILNEVTFASRYLDFGTFKIQMFSKKELDDITGQAVNNVFYPSAQLDTDFLSRYPFLVEELPNRREDKTTGGIDSDDDWDKREQWRRIKLPMPQTSIQLLALYTWQRGFTEDALMEIRDTGQEFRESLGWTGFNSSKTFTVSTDLFAAPSNLESVTSETGLLSGFGIRFTEEQESELKAVVAKGQRLLHIVQAVGPRWEFVENAMGYLGKAFLATPNLEQLLWNTIVIECLLSENKDHTTKLMRDRLGNILGRTGEERSTVKEEFQDVYEFRCALVHGNCFDRKTRFHHLNQARDLARRIMMWFVDYLLWVDAFYQQRKIGFRDYPERKDLLAPLDGDASSFDRLNRKIAGFTI